MNFIISGLSDYEGFRCELYRDTDLFIVCFDIGNPQSLENVQEIVSFDTLIISNQHYYVCVLRDIM